jgi:hypothetical protein
MVTCTELEYIEAIRAMSQRMNSSRQSQRSSRPSPVQSLRGHSARVEKSKSHHASPKTPERRRAVAAPKHYSAMEDHYRRMMGLDEDEEQDNTTDQQHQPVMRPVSWHPSSSASYDAFANGYTSIYTTDPSPTAQYLSYQSSPFYHHARPWTESESAWSQYMYGVTNAATAQGQLFSTQQESTSWFTTTQTRQPESQTKSAWNEIADDDDRAAREESVELVGLGLYDEPGFTVKIGSKLEEECEPPDFEDMDDEDEESSEEEEDELPKPEDTKVTQASLPMVDMSGQSFFLGSDEDFKNNWWSNSDNKQPQSQVRAVNCGWI